MTWTAEFLADVGGWGHHMDGWGWGGAVVGWLVMILVATAIAWLVWSASRRLGERRSRSPSARELLDERYARGEITREEYLQRREDLSH
ncbi:MAG TPA: SHOCT domain-containing protein [Acidimicrobiia bacterium]|nr:SHOCT domain-containing protein [Acidimicrobiia bacterium]